MSRFSQYFRTGSQEDSAFETVLKNLNKARGNAYSSYQDEDTSSLVYVENLAYAKAISEIYGAAQRAKNQLDPNKMSVFIPRWNQLLGIIPNYDDTIDQQKAVIAIKLALLSKRPINAELENLCRAYLGEYFVEIIHDISSNNQGSIGNNESLTISGGVTLPADTSWHSGLSHIIIRCWQPRTPEGQVLETDFEYDQRVNRLLYVLDDFLPAYVEASVMRFYKESAQNVFKIGTDLIDGDFDPYPGTWTTIYNAVMSQQSYDDYYAIRLQNNNPALSNTCIIGKLAVPGVDNNRQYRVTGEYRTSWSSGRALFSFESTSGHLLGSSTDWAAFDILTTTNTTANFQLYTDNLGDGSNYIEWRNLTVERVHMTDGNMELSGLTNYGQTVWLAANAYSTVTKSTENPHSGTQCLKIEMTDNASNKGARQSHFAVGKSYIIRGYARGDGVIAPKIILYRSLTSSYEPVWTGTSSTAWQRFELPISLHLNNIILGNNDPIAGTVYFDDVYLDDMFLNDMNMEYRYMDYWTTSGGAAAAKSTDAYSDFRSLRITSNGPAQYVSNTSTALKFGEVYTLEGYWKTDSLGARPAIRQGATLSYTYEANYVGETWTPFSWTFYCQGELINFYNANSTSNTSYIYVDDLRIYTHNLKSIDSAKDLLISDKIEVVDDNNDPQLYSLERMYSFTTTTESVMVMTEPVRTNISNQKYRKLGFYLDESNLDKLCFADSEA